MNPVYKLFSTYLTQRKEADKARQRFADITSACQYYAQQWLGAHNLKVPQWVDFKVFQYDDHTIVLKVYSDKKCHIKAISEEELEEVMGGRADAGI